MPTACLDEDLFPVNSGKEKQMTVSQISGPPPDILSVENTKMESGLSSGLSLVSNINPCEQGLENKHGFSRPDNLLQNEEMPLSLNEIENDGPDDDCMYLSNCRVYICGFPAPDFRKYVKMVREGGGTRFMEFNERVTHVILGTSMDSSEKDLRQRSWVGSIHFVLPIWLEECHQQRKEITVAQKHIAMEDILQKESKHSQLSGKHWSLLPESSDVELHKSAGSVEGVEMRKDLSNGQHERLYTSQQRYVRDLENSGYACEPTPSGDSEMQLETKNLAATEERAGHSSILNGKAIFNGYCFAISDSFPVERRAEIVQWVTEGGGFMKNEGGSQTDTTRNIDFVVVTHGSRLASPAWKTNAKPVSSHWIRFCLEEERLLDLESHVLYQPLRCRVPFPGFEALRLCVSQYEEKERLLLRNLCFVLGAKFTEKLTKKVTHLLCKVKDGQKYQAACSWGISITTADWLFGCATKDEILPLHNFQPRELLAAEKGGTLGMTQGPIQTSCPAEMGSDRTAEPDTSGFQVANKGSTKTKRPAETRTTEVDETMTYLSERNKYFLMTTSKPSQNGPSLLDPWDAQTAQWSEIEGLSDKTPPMNSKEADSCNGKRKESCPPRSPSPAAASIEVDLGEHATRDPPVVILDGKDTRHTSDVAAAIEGLLAQTSKLKGQTAVDSLSIDQEISPEHITIKRPREERRFKRPKHRPISNEKCIPSPSLKSSPKELPSFDESLVESQVIGYGEDGSGKELIIERVRTRSMSAIGESGRLAAAAAWRNDGLGRLFRVAEDNK